MFVKLANAARMTWRWMPPSTYLAAAVALAVLVAASMAARPGLAAICWPWTLAAAACVLAIAGAFRIVRGIGAPRWIAAVLALPAYMWAVGVIKLLSDQPVSVMERIVFGLAAQLAFLAAAGGAIGLVAWLSRPRSMFRVGVAVLATFAVLSCADAMMAWNGLSLATSTYWLTPFLAARATAMLVAYTAFVGAAWMLSMRHDGEPWTAIVISLIAADMLTDTLRLTVLLEARAYAPSLWGYGVVLTGAAAVWRMGAVLGPEIDAGRRADTPIGGEV